MKTKPVLPTLLVVCASFFGHAANVATTNTAAPFVLSGQPPRVHNRQVTPFTEGNRKALRFDERTGDGLAWWPDANVANGTIEFDVRGKDVFQKSFVGVAFHGVDEKTYDAVYFRPFNFRATDPARRNHAVQYVSLPTHDWQKLRTEQPEKYEKPVVPAPAPGQWFHARVVVAHPKVSVFVNDATEPCLVVEQLSQRKSGWVGFWVGNGSGGDFANLKITPGKLSPFPTTNKTMNTPSNVESKIVRRERFLVMGTLTQITSSTESGEKFAAIWSEFEAHREQIKPHSTDQKYYGVSFPTAADGRFDYFAGTAITPVQTVPTGLVVREVPAAMYAVFACPVAAIGQTKRYIFTEWRSKSGQQIDDTAPAFEQYPPAEVTESPVLIHIPLRERPAK